MFFKVGKIWVSRVLTFGVSEVTDLEGKLFCSE